jgi:hypothetical protein
MQRACYPASAVAHSSYPLHLTWFILRLVLCAGTLLVPRERTADVYLRYGAKYGVTLTEQQVLERFRR